MAFRTERIQVDGSINIDGSIYQWNTLFVGGSGNSDASLNNLYAFNTAQEGSIANLYAFNPKQEASISNLYARVNYVDSCLGWNSILTTKTNASLGLINIATLNASIGAINVSLNLLTQLTYKQDVSMGIATALNTAEEASIKNLYDRVNYVDSCLGWNSILTTKTNASLGLINIATLNASIGAINTSLNLITYLSYKQDVSLGQLEAFNDAQEASISNLYARVNYLDPCLGWSSILSSKSNASLGLFNPATINASIGAINTSLNLITYFSYKQDVSIGISALLDAKQDASINRIFGDFIRSASVGGGSSGLKWDGAYIDISITSNLKFTNGALDTSLASTGGLSDIEVSANYTALSNYIILVNCSYNSVNITLPTSPANGDVISVVDVAKNSSVNNINILRNGHNIMKNASDFTINVNGGSIDLLYHSLNDNFAVTNLENLTGYYSSSSILFDYSAIWTVETITGASRNVLTTDLFKTFTCSSTGTTTFYLPSVDTGQIGYEYTFNKLSSGTLIIDAADSDVIEDSGAGATIYCADSGSATITLKLITASQWIIKFANGTWITTT